MTTYALVIPTLNAGERWKQTVHAIQAQGLLPDKVLVIDSGSSDSTVSIAKEAGFDIHAITSLEFEHGRTRQLAVDMLAEYDFLVFMTQDAVLVDEGSLAAILAPLDKHNHVAAVCGRQLPHDRAGVFACHLRKFNYPPLSYTVRPADIARLGIRAAFISNSFAAYRRSALVDVGGFPQNIIMGEDTSVVARMLFKGYQSAYCGDACVYHSHNYSVMEEFKRYFDTGVFHSREPGYIEKLGNPRREGMEYVKSEYQYIRQRTPLRLPEMCIRILSKYAGYKLGLYEKHLPNGIKRYMSMNSRFWGE